MFNSKHINILKDRDIKEVLQGASIAFILKISGAALAFFLNIVLARELGAEWCGIYFLAISICLAGGTVGRLGFENITLRLVASKTNKGQWGEVLSINDKIALITFLVSTALGLTLFKSAPWISQVVFGKPELAATLKIMSLSIPPATVVAIYSQMLRGIKKIALFTLISGICVPLFTIVFFVLSSFKTIEILTVSYFISTVIAALAGIVCWNFFVPANVVKKRSNDPIAQGASNFYLIAVIELITTWAATYVLGAYGTSEELGFFGIANRTATIISFVLISMNSISAPVFAQLYSENNIKKLESVAQKSVLIMLVFSSPLLILFIFFPSLVMSIFGSDFSNAASLLCIIAVGQVVNIATGSVSYILMMTGHERELRNIVIFVSFSNLILTFLLVKYFNATGAALSVTAAIVIKNVIAYWYVRKKIGIQVFPFPWQYNILKNKS